MYTPAKEHWLVCDCPRLLYRGPKLIFVWCTQQIQSIKTTLDGDKVMIPCCDSQVSLSYSAGPGWSSAQVTQTIVQTREKHKPASSLARLLYTGTRPQEQHEFWLCDFKAKKASLANLVFLCTAPDCVNSLSIPADFQAQEKRLVKYPHRYVWVLEIWCFRMFLGKIVSPWWSIFEMDVSWMGDLIMDVIV